MTTKSTRSPAAAFTVDGSTNGASLHPTRLAAGPWDPSTMHGSPLAGVMARALERAAPGGGHLVSFRLDILRAVPLEPVEIRSGVTRPGRRVRQLWAELAAGGDPMAQATAIWMQKRAVDVHVAPSDDVPHQGPDSGTPQVFPAGADRRGFNTTVDARFISGGGEPGPATAWVRLEAPLVLGEVTSPLQRLIGTTDLANGIASPLDFRRYVYINPDLSAQILRVPTDEWICLDSRCSIEPTGIGVSRTTLYDSEGVVGYSTQTLFVDARRP